MAGELVSYTAHAVVGFEPSCGKQIDTNTKIRVNHAICDGEGAIGTFALVLALLFLYYFKQLALALAVSTN